MCFVPHSSHACCVDVVHLLAILVYRCIDIMSLDRSGMWITPRCRLCIASRRTESTRRFQPCCPMTTVQVIYPETATQDTTSRPTPRRMTREPWSARAAANDILAIYPYT